MSLLGFLSTLTIKTWRPRPNTPAYRVQNTLKGPDIGVNASWWDIHYAGATYSDVLGLSDEDLAGAIAYARVSTVEELLRKMGLYAPTSTPAYVRKTWAEMTRAEREDAIDEAQINYAEAGRKVSRAQVAKLLASHA